MGFEIWISNIMEGQETDDVTDPDEIMFDLRREMFELLDDLKELNYSGADDFARYLETTRDNEAPAQIPKLLKKKDQMHLENTFNRKIKDQAI